MKRLLIAIWVLLILLVCTNTLWFCYIDKKIDRAIEKQNEINEWTYQTIENQEKLIRVTETNNEVMFSIVTNGDYYEKD